MNNLFQFSDKKATCLTKTEIKVSRIPRNRELIWISLSISSKTNIFYTLIILFHFISQFCRSAILFSRTLYLFFQVTLCNQPIVVYVTESDMRQGPSNHTQPSYELLVSILWLTLNIGEVSKPAEKCTKNLGDKFHCRYTCIK